MLIEDVLTEFKRTHLEHIEDIVITDGYEDENEDMQVDAQMYASNNEMAEDDEAMEDGVGAAAASDLNMRSMEQEEENQAFKYVVLEKGRVPISIGDYEPVLN